MSYLLENMARQRSEGAWELLATAAGNPAAIKKSCEMLSGTVLDDFVHPDWMIEERVEALSAFDPKLLASLARDWPKPIRSTSPFIRNAWRVGLRHLLPIMQIDIEEFDVPELEEETSILRQADSAELIYWSHVLDSVESSPIFNYAQIRKFSRCQIIGPLPTQAELARFPAWMLPLLRGQVYRLESSARDFLAKCGQRCLSSDLRSGAYISKSIDIYKNRQNNSFSINYISLGDLDLAGNASAAPPIIELCREISGELVEELGNALADQIQRMSDPKLAAPLVNLLLTRWTLP